MTGVIDGEKNLVQEPYKVRLTDPRPVSGGFVLITFIGGEERDQEFLDTVKQVLGDNALHVLIPIDRYSAAEVAMLHENAKQQLATFNNPVFQQEILNVKKAQEALQEAEITVSNHIGNLSYWLVKNETMPSPPGEQSSILEKIKKVLE